MTPNIRKITSSISSHLISNLFHDMCIHECVCAGQKCVCTCHYYVGDNTLIEARNESICGGVLQSDALLHRVCSSVQMRPEVGAGTHL